MPDPGSGKQLHFSAEPSPLHALEKENCKGLGTEYLAGRTSGQSSAGLQVLCGNSTLQKGIHYIKAYKLRYLHLSVRTACNIPGMRDCCSQFCCNLLERNRGADAKRVRGEKKPRSTVCLLECLSICGNYVVIALSCC